MTVAVDFMWAAHVRCDYVLCAEMAKQVVIGVGAVFRSARGSGLSFAVGPPAQHQLLLWTHACSDRLDKLRRHASVLSKIGRVVYML